MATLHSRQLTLGGLRVPFARFAANKARLFELLAIALSCAMAASAKTNTLTIIQTTDIHTSEDLARLATHIVRERKANSDVLVDCGDLTRGSFAATVDDGEAEVATLNKLRYDVWVPGNHEFRAGQGHLRHVLEQFKSGDVLAANLSFKEAPAPRRKILPWKIYKRSGLHVAVIGLISPDTERWYGGILYKGIETCSAKEALEAVMPAVREAKPDVIVVAAHLGAYSPSGDTNAPLAKLPEYIASYPDISLLLAGHTHQKIQQRALSDTCWMIQPPTHAKAASRITLSFDTDARRVVSVTNVFLYAKDAEPWPKMPKEWVRRPEVAKRAGAEVVAVIPAGVSLRPSKDPAEVNPMRVFCARAMAEATGADAALAEIGKRASMSTGAVTRATLYNFASHENYLSVITVTPDELRRIVDEQKAKGCPLVPYGLDYGKLPDHPIRLALGAYAANGSDGAYPVLRTIAESGQVSREDTEIAMRDSIGLLLRRLYPPPAAR